MNKKKENKNQEKDARLYNKNFMQACENATNGIVYCATTQTNITKELILGTLVMILSLFYNFTTSEFLCLTFAVFFVIFAEFINTAIETIVDLYVDVYHPKAKIAKDVGAGAVVLTAINAIIVAYFLFFRETELTQMANSIFNQVLASPTHLVFVAAIITLIAILAMKGAFKKKEMTEGKDTSFLPSGQAALAFAILAITWIYSKNLIIFCLTLTLAIMIIGNRIYNKKTFGEVLYGAFMGVLIVLMVYGLTIFKM